MIFIDTKNNPECCPCGDAIEHSPAAHTDLNAAIEVATQAAETAHHAVTTTERWLAVVRKLAGTESRS